MQENIEVVVELHDLEPEFGHALNLGLTMRLGDIFVNGPSKVCGVGRFNKTGDVVYFCCWEQPNMQANIYFMPNWVQSHILRRLKKEELVVKYYEN